MACRINSAVGQLGLPAADRTLNRLSSCSAGRARNFKRLGPGQGCDIGDLAHSLLGSANNYEAGYQNEQRQE